MNAKQSSCKLTNDQCVCTVFAQRPLCTQCAPAELLLRCRRPYCAAMVTLRCPLCALLGRRATVFVLSMLKVRTVAIYAIPPRPMAMPLRCYGDACVRTARTSAFFIFLGRCGITVRTLPWCDRGFIIGGTLLSIDNFLFTLFYAVILHITSNFKFFSMHCCADDASRVRRMLDENESSRVVPHFFFKNLTCLFNIQACCFEILRFPYLQSRKANSDWSTIITWSQQPISCGISKTINI